VGIRPVVRKSSARDSLSRAVKPIDRMSKQRETGTGSGIGVRPVVRRERSILAEILGLEGSSTVRPIDRTTKQRETDKYKKFVREEVERIV